MVPRFLNTAARIVTVSEATRNDVLQFYHLDPARVTVVYNGLDWDRLAALPSTSDEPGQSPYLVYVGNLHPHKNLQRFIEAFARSRSAGGYQLYLVGRKDRRFYPGLLQRAASLGVNDRVRFLGYLDNERVWTLIKRARALVFPSLYEGFGLPPLEAMALGTPVLASRIPSVEEVCEGAVSYIDPLSVADMTRGLDEILEDQGLRLRLIDQGQAQARKFSWENTAKGLLEAFREVTTR
jgi:glycosyltransferase involved in cell wall biosynthesis